jgi:hypothetical protein
MKFGAQRNILILLITKSYAITVVCGIVRLWIPDYAQIVKNKVALG